MNVGQKAPSAKRCIKTHKRYSLESDALTVRKHRAPKGALRLVPDEMVRVPV